jgi:hypothetical protein
MEYPIGVVLRNHLNITVQVDGVVVVRLVCLINTEAIGRPVDGGTGASVQMVVVIGNYYHGRK